MFMENRQQGKDIRSSLKFPPITVLGGFTVGEEVPKPLFEAKTESKHGKSLWLKKTTILFDNDDIKFLLQFPQNKWADALTWRYGEGLRYYSLTGTDKMSGSNPETDAQLKDLEVSIPSWILPGTNFYMKGLYEKLTGKYGYYLPRSKDRWKSETDENGKKTGQWFTRNYKSLTQSSMSNAIGNWHGGVSSSFLGKRDNIPFVPIVSLDEEGQEIRKAGRKSTNVTYDAWNHRLLNHSAASGMIRPVFTKQIVENMNINPDLVAVSTDKNGILTIRYKLSNGQFGPAQYIPLLLPGKMVASDRDAGYTGYEKTAQKINEEAKKLFDYSEELGLQNEQIITEEMLRGIANGTSHAADTAKELLGYMEIMPTFHPDSGHENAAQVITPEQQLEREESSAPGQTKTIGGGITPADLGLKQSPVSRSFLNKMKISRNQYHHLISAFCVQAPDTGTISRTLPNGNTLGDTKVLNPSGGYADCQIFKALIESLKTLMSSKVYHKSHKEAIMSEDFEYLQIGREQRIYEICGLKEFTDFIEAFITETNIRNTNGIQSAIKANPASAEVNGLWKQMQKTVLYEMKNSFTLMFQRERSDAGGLYQQLHNKQVGSTNIVSKVTGKESDYTDPNAIDPLTGQPYATGYSAARDDEEDNKRRQGQQIIPAVSKEDPVAAAVHRATSSRYAKAGLRGAKLNLAPDASVAGTQPAEPGDLPQQPAAQAALPKWGLGSYKFTAQELEDNLTRPGFIDTFIKNVIQNPKAMHSFHQFAHASGSAKLKDLSDMAYEEIGQTPPEMPLRKAEWAVPGEEPQVEQAQPETPVWGRVRWAVPK